jgi:hypothetical protein
VKAKQASLPWFELVQVTLGYYCLVWISSGYLGLLLSGLGLG